MIERARSYSIRLFERWTDFIGHHSPLALFLSLLATIGVLIYTANHFRINTELTDMISDKLPYRKLEKEFQRAFPQFKETIVVVIDTDTPEAARLYRDKLTERLKKERGLFKGVYAPGSGDFFERNGLLYLSIKDLEALSEHLAIAQPLLGLISKDFTLRGLFSVIERIVSQEGDIEQKKKLVPFLDRLAQTFESSTSSMPRPVSWQKLILGDAAVDASRQFIILDPGLDPAAVSGGEACIKAIYRIRDELNLDEASGVRVRLTGDVVLNYENLRTLNKGMGLTTLISFLLVAVAITIGLGSGRLVFASLITLLMGFIWTLGFAIFFVGHLTLISVAFGVLFIGLGIDYAIQYCLRYRELITSGLGHHEAIAGTAKGLGVSLLVCTVAAAIGFYSFLPTPYTGVSELGVIAGTGMLINLFTTLTVLPALLTVLPFKKRPGTKEFVLHRSLYQVPYKHAKAIVAGAVAIGIGAAFFLPKLYFDYNPLNLYDPHLDAVLTIKELFRNEMSCPWTISVLARNAEDAKEMIGRLKGLKEVQEAITLTSFIPEDQPSKLAILSDIALFMPPDLGILKTEKLSYEKKVASLKSFESSLKKVVATAPERDRAYITSVSRLLRSLERFKRALTKPENGKEALDKLEQNLLSYLPNLFHEIQTSLRASAVKETDLPQELRSRYVTPDGRYRVEVFPRGNILKPDSLKRFVEAVSALAPNSTDTPVTIRHAGNAVVRSFLMATLYALLAISLFMLIELKSASDTILVLLPLGLSLLITGAASVIFDIPFNFANVIVIPLLLGSGVEGIYLIHRFRTDPPPSGNMLETSTARALFFSTLTTILSFSTLSFSPHQGMASMGKLLTICIGSLMITTLIFLPALLKFVKPRARDSGLKD